MGAKEGWSITRVHIRIATLEVVVALGFLLHLGMSVYLACHLPLFHHCDEANHFDCALKLSRGIWPHPHMLREPDVLSLQASNHRSAVFAYTGAWPMQGPRGPKHSFEAVQPKLFYVPAAACLWLASSLGASVPDQIVLLRIVCALLAFLSRILIYCGIRNLSRPAALLAAVYLVFRVPADLLRVSNDSMVAVLGAALFFVLTLSSHFGRRWHIAAISGIVLCTAATKQTAFLFSAIVVVCVFCVSAFRASFSWRHLVIVLAPATVLTALMTCWNWMTTGNPSGIPVDATHTLIPPEGHQALGRLFTAGAWLKWHEVILTSETLVSGLKGDRLFPLQQLVTYFILGQIGAFCLVVASWCGRFPEDPDRTVECRDALKWAKCGLLSVLCMEAMTTVFIAEIGQIWISYRFLAGVEAIPILAASIGWYSLGRLLPKAAPALWTYAICTALLPCVLNTIAYLQLTQR